MWGKNLLLAFLPRFLERSARCPGRTLHDARDFAPGAPALAQIGYPGDVQDFLWPAEPLTLRASIA
jgi:hypothetical protein